jgi:hypothetical protein
VVMVWSRYSAAGERRRASRSATLALVAEGSSEGGPCGVIQPGAAGVGQCREKLAVAFAPVVGQMVEVLAQRFPDRGRNAARIEPFGGRVEYASDPGERIGGHSGNQEVPAGPLRDHGGQPITHGAPGAVLGPGGAGRARLVHPVLGEQGGSELMQSIGVEVGVAVEVDEIVIVGWSLPGRAVARPAHRGCRRPAAGWRRRPAARAALPARPTPQ